MFNNTKSLTKAGVLLAILIVLQIVTKSFGQMITGSCVNFVLAICAFILELGYGIAVAFISPFLAFIVGVGPAFLPIVPCVSIGNVAFVVCLHFLFKKLNNTFALREVGVIASSLVKFIFLYVLVVVLIIPSLGLPDAKAGVISTMFSFPQLITAIIGGTLANIVNSYIPKS